jgi:hypothetical protein
MAQVVEHLPSKHEALSTTKNQNITNLFFNSFKHVKLNVFQVYMRIFREDKKISPITKLVILCILCDCLEYKSKYVFVKILL